MEHGPKNTEWNFWGDSLLVISLNMLIALPLKTFSVYWINFADALDMTRYQFAWIIVAFYLGIICSNFLSPLNVMIYKKSKNVTICYGIYAAILLILFMSFSYISSLYARCALEAASIFCFGLTFNAIYPNATHLATFYTLEEDKVERLASFIDMGWPMTTVLFVAVGYAFDYTDGFVIVLSLMALSILFLSLVMWFSWRNKFNINEYELEQMDASANNDFQIILNEIWFNIKQYKWLMLASYTFWVANGLIYNTMPGLWFEDLYGFSSSEVGLFCLALFAVEVAFNMGMVFTINKIGVWVFIISNLSISIIIVLVTIVLNQFMHLPFVYVAFVVLLLYGLVLIQYACDLIIILKIAADGNFSPRIIISIWFMLIFCGFMTSVLILAHVWDYGRGLNVILYLICIFFVICGCAWVVIYSGTKTDEKEEYESIQQNDNV